MISVSLSREQGPECFLLRARGIGTLVMLSLSGVWRMVDLPPGVFFKFLLPVSLVRRNSIELSVCREELPLAPDFLSIVTFTHSVPDVLFPFWT